MQENENKIVIRRLNYSKYSIDNVKQPLPQFSKTTSSFHPVQTLNHKLTFLSAAKKKNLHSNSEKQIETQDLFQTLAQQQFKINSELSTRADGFFYEPAYSKIIPIPDETDIRSNFRFKLPIIIASKENENADIHFMEAFQHAFVLIQNYIDSVKRESERINEESKQLRQEIKDVSFLLQVKTKY